VVAVLSSVAPPSAPRSTRSSLADHDFATEAQELRANTELTRAIQ
jgi:hypothetical protein